MAVGERWREEEERKGTHIDPTIHSFPSYPRAGGRGGGGGLKDPPYYYTLPTWIDTKHVRTYVYSVCIHTIPTQGYAS